MNRAQCGLPKDSLLYEIRGPPAAQAYVYRPLFLPYSLRLERFERCLLTEIPATTYSGICRRLDIYTAVIYAFVSHCISCISFMVSCTLPYHSYLVTHIRRARYLRGPLCGPSVDAVYANSVCLSHPRSHAIPVSRA